MRSTRLIFGAIGTTRRAQSIWAGLGAKFGHAGDRKRRRATEAPRTMAKVKAFLSQRPYRTKTWARGGSKLWYSRSRAPGSPASGGFRSPGAKNTRISNHLESTILFCLTRLRLRAPCGRTNEVRSAFARAAEGGAWPSGAGRSVTTLRANYDLAPGCLSAST